MTLKPGDISKEEAIKAFDAADKRMGEAPWWGDRPEILYDGEWRRLLRTDLKDDVCTTSGERGQTLDEAVSTYRKKIMSGLGVRIGPGKFAVIDSYTDG